MAETFSFGGTFDDAGEIGNAEAFAVAVFYHSQIGSDGCKCIIGDLGFGCGDNGEKC